ncbi:RNA polymerase subunit sigma [Streptomyces sp. AcH 505]|uniref:zf-HC2 domain-containing protein n=1 Tax=unclassified Streptomyces TaxID=2593676 RepID=UPI0005921B84|nr:zf-HC2 domain-containing protein [Streptomyces sp. NBC_00370]KIF69656.1 RNA polymerase subunit sigma [Streptomyces sp. AcH 505]
MTTHDQYGLDGEGTVHDAVASYVLGILDEADAVAFEAHLAACELCTANMAEFSGMEPMLAMLADTPETFATAEPQAPAADPFPRQGGFPPRAVPLPPTPSVSVKPSDQLLNRLVDEVAVKRAQRKRRGFYLIAAAAALIIGGPTIAIVATSGDDPVRNEAVVQPSGGPTDAEAFAKMPDKVSGTDPATKVSATIGFEERGWGTNAVLELKNVKGPLKCSLVAVSKSGDEQVVSSWSVPQWGYGIPSSPHEVAQKPLYIHGGAAIQPNDIDHFDVRTFDGKRLVQVGA